MPVTFLHTADWQLGKPFGSVADADKRALLQQERLRCLERIGALAAEHGAAFVLVAGDLFDSPSPTKHTVSRAFHAIGAMGVPVVAIPGNHDFGGPGGPWTQDFVRAEAEALAPNFRILTAPEPLVLDDAVILPAPLGERHVTTDPTAWIRDACDDLPADRPRVLLAHGSVHGFSSAGDEDASAATNQLDLDRLPAGEIDYLALGDWHGTKEIDARTWYAGTPEIDRFPRGDDNRPGHVLRVTAGRGKSPEVEMLPTGALTWHRLAFHFDTERGVDALAEAFADVVGTGADGALLRLELDGHLDIRGTIALRELLDTWESRLVRLKLYDRVAIAPSEEEIHGLTERAEDPLIARVATRLLEESTGGEDDAAIARHALRSLYQKTMT